MLANELLLREVLKAVPYMKGRLLDVGCGEKPYRDIVSTHVDSYTGIDLVQTIHARHAIDVFADAHYSPFKKDTLITFFPWGISLLPSNNFLDNKKSIRL